MNSRDRVLMALHHEEADRVPTWDQPWVTALHRWYREGLPTNVNPAEYFDWDIVYFSADTTPRFSIEVIEETEDYFIQRTSYGGIARELKDYGSVPEMIEPPCRNRDDWERIKHRLVPSRDRVDWKGDWGITMPFHDRTEWRIGLPGCRKAREAGKFMCYYDEVGFDDVQFYVGVERLLVLMADDPEWVRDMYETTATLTIEMCEIMKEGGFEFDGAFLGCDLGYRNGLLFSPRMFQELLRPTLQRLFDYFKGGGMPVILHSDGDVRKLIPYFAEDGVTCLHPLEVKAGMDLIRLKEEWGDKLAFTGGIDVRAMADEDPKLIEEEIRSKITVAKRGGGYIYHSDHSVPGNVSLAQYQRVLELVKQYGHY